MQQHVVSKNPEAIAAPCGDVRSIEASAMPLGDADDFSMPYGMVMADNGDKRLSLQSGHPH